MRFSLTSPGNMTIFQVQGNKLCHILVSITEDRILIGKGKNSKAFEGLHDFFAYLGLYFFAILLYVLKHFLFLAKLGYKYLQKRGEGKGNIKEIIEKLPRKEIKPDFEDGYEGAYEMVSSNLINSTHTTHANDFIIIFILLNLTCIRWGYLKSNKGQTSSSSSCVIFDGLSSCYSC